MSTWTFPSLPEGARYLVLGLGETGGAAARWGVRHGGGLRVADTRSEPPGRDTLLQAAGHADVDWRLGDAALQADVLDGIDAVVLSPGLCPFDEPVAGLLVEAATREIPVLGEMELFARALADMREQGYAPQVLAITGTNGKTTVTSMTRQLVQAAGLKAVAAGNISPAALQALAKAIDTNDLPDVWVLELSSFQLHTLKSLQADAAVVLNITQDHLDWHGSLQAYAASKAALYGMARQRVVNRDDPLVVDMVPRLDAMNVRSFGRGVPQLEGDMGLESDHGITWLASSEPLDFERLPARTPRGRKQVELLRTPGRLVQLMPVDAMRVRGEHNAMNALAALALLRTLGLGWAEPLNALRDYVGQPHRTQFVRSIQGIDFVNDSKGTNVGASVAAIEGMGAPVVLIAGGLGKGQDFTPLAQAVAGHARAVVLIGQDAPLIAQALEGVAVPVQLAATLDDAVEQAWKAAKPGDTVLLSPACASMDMFRNYGHRGQAFAEAVDELARQQGEVA